MADPYRIIGAEMSPYSVKVRAYFRYKNIPHIWLPRFQHGDEFQKFAKLPIIPLVVSPDGQGMQDSTPIIEAMEARFPEPSIHPGDPTLKFLSALIEEYGDEWGNKLMFHHRWHALPDQMATSHVLARDMAPNGDRAAIDAVAEKVRERMVSRVHFVGSSEENAPLISAYLDTLLEILEPHLEGREYILGDRPAFADFGLAPQVYEMALDPTAGAIIRARTPNVLAWVYRMTSPRREGAFDSWDNLKETLTPLLRNAGAYFLPWSKANAQALMAEKDSFGVDLAGSTYVQPPQKYHAKSLQALRERYQAVENKDLLAPILEKTGCLSYLQ